MHWRIILRNIFSNWLGYLTAAVIALLLSPFVVHHLGNTGYGIWTLVLAITGYFGMLDFGIRSSVGRFVARYLALAEPRNVNRTVSNAIAVLTCGSILTVLASAAMALALPMFGLSAHYQAAGRTALFLAALNIALALPMGVFGGVLVALERYDILSRIGIAASLVQAALTVIVLNRGYGIVALAVVALFVTAVQYGVIAWFAKRLYAPLRVGWDLVDTTGRKELLSFSAYRFVYIVANQLIFYTDTIVVGAFLGAAAITPYAIAGSLITRGRDVVSLATDTLYPAASRMDGLNDRTGITNLYAVCTTLALLLGLPLCLGFLFLGKQFITLWMGREYVFSATILAILAIPQFTSMPQHSSSLVLASMARHKTLAFIAIAEGIANLALSIVLVRKIGIIGVAWGTVIPHLITTAVVIPIYTLRVLNIRTLEFLKMAVLRPVLCVVPAGVLCYAFSRTAATISWGLFGVEVAAVAGAVAVMAYLVSLTPQQKLALRGKLTKPLWTGSYAD